MSYRMTAPRAATTPKVVRDWLVLLLVTFGHEEIADQARLCASEAVTNAYQHTRADRITVEVSLGSAAVTVSVDDDRPEWLPSPRPPTTWREEHGRGLALIRAHAAELRAIPNDTGKRVQFTLAYGEAA
ncbi:ATP-binding protein [Streptomyces sp. JS01]|uniref:ATP-binding protein n=1 Tax=Streptomyces sp. JS01 TaxID=1525753 RepID=UPI00067C7A3C|nr:ATP-binding protein [Streptomyces sp. JS01]